MKELNGDLLERHRRRRMLRSAKTKATEPRAISGGVREQEKPKPVTLPRIKGLEENADG